MDNLINISCPFAMCDLQMVKVLDWFQINIFYYPMCQQTLDHDKILNIHK